MGSRSHLIIVSPQWVETRIRGFCPSRAYAGRQSWSARPSPTNHLPMTHPWERANCELVQFGVIRVPGRGYRHPQVNVHSNNHRCGDDARRRTDAQLRGRRVWRCSPKRPEGAECTLSSFGQNGTNLSVSRRVGGDPATVVVDVVCHRRAPGLVTKSEWRHRLVAGCATLRAGSGSAPRGGCDPSGRRLVAAPAGSQSEPDPGAMGKNDETVVGWGL